MHTRPIAIISVIFASLLTATGQLFMKYGSTTFEFNILKLITNTNLWIAAFFYITAVVILIYSFKFGELSVLYPFIALSYVWVSFLSIYFLNESIGVLRWSGIASIILGVSFIGWGGRQ